jgi:predicted site-specific integrase-resolvase
MKLSEWAKRQGITYKTAHRWFQQGILPAETTQLPTGTILVRDESSPSMTGIALYARVSSSDQKGDLERQLARLVQFATERELPVTKVVTEVASGMNPRRSKLLRLLKDPTVRMIVVEHRERLARFGVE